MIAKLTGILDQLTNDGAVIDVNGVGYLVQASARTLARLGVVGDRVSLVTECVIRDERMILYGFADSNERDWFHRLTAVQGVGARLALSILGILDPETLVRAIAAQDKTALIRADGVGAKLAARVINELKDKVGDIALGPSALASSSSSPARTATTAGTSGAPADTAAADAVSALVNLGYGRSEAFAAVTHVQRQPGMAGDVATLIRLALKELSP